MSAIRVIAVPYELGRLREGVGCGPERLLDAGAEAALAVAGATVQTEIVELDTSFTDTGMGDEDAGFELMRLVSARVRATRSRGEFPVVLSGSCFVGVGVVAGLDESAPGAVWLDAHADFNEPTTAISGYFDGMGLSVLTGGAWPGLLATVPSARPLPETSVVLAGARGFDPPELERLAASAVAYLRCDELRSPETLVDAVGSLTPVPTGLYVHLDLDVLDAEVAEVNVYAASGGLRARELEDLVDALLRTFPVRAVSLTAYDPEFDGDGRVPPIALRVLERIGALAS